MNREAARNSPGLPPRLHNVLSYSVATFVLPAVVAWKGALPSALLPAALWFLHFARRSLESAFVHRYGGRRISPTDSALEYLYYWGFGTWIGFGLSSADWTLPEATLYPGVALFAIGELGNFRAHILLRRLREGSDITARRIPEGFLFRWVSCPHYLFEILSWLGIALVCQVIAAWAFFGLVSVILVIYAHQRHVRYREEFDGTDGKPQYPTERRSLVPFVF